MKTRTIQIYSFTELSEEAKKKAIEKMRYSDWYLADDWYEHIYIEWAKKLNTMGFYDVDINYSGFSSQGDGASFTATVDVTKWLKFHKLGNLHRSILNEDEAGNVSIKITQQGRYVHEMSMNVDVSFYGMNQKAYDTIDALGDKMLQDAREQAALIYKDLQDEYYTQRSDDSISDFIEANEYEFLESGELA